MILRDEWIAQLARLALKHWQEFRVNRRLQAGVAAILLVLFVEGGLRWSDHLIERSNELRELDGKLLALRAQSRSEQIFRKTLADVQAKRVELAARLWVVPSEAVGQARLKDWVTDGAKQAGALNLVLNLANTKALGGKAGAADQTDLVLSENESSQSQLFDLREFRINVSFVFTPEALETFLGRIESGDTFSAVESLVVNRRERRVEALVKVLMRVDSSADARLASVALAHYVAQ